MPCFFNNHNKYFELGVVMRFYKKILLISISLLFSQITFAEIIQTNHNEPTVIELNNHDIAICQEQLFTIATQDQNPVILLYASDQYSAMFLSTYETVASRM